MTGRTSNAELSQRIPIDRRMVLLAEPPSAAQQPAFAQLVMGEVEVVETEFCSAANTNVVILRRPRKRLVKTNWASVIHRQHRTDPTYRELLFVDLVRCVEVRPDVLHVVVIVEHFHEANHRLRLLLVEADRV